MTRDAFDLTGQVAIVTGGGTGIGAATTRVFAEYGAAAIVIAARTESDLERTAAAVRADFPSTRILGVPTNVKDEASVQQLVARTMSEFGQIDILINNAGGTRMGPLEATATRSWDSIFELNVRGPFLCTREVGQHMIKQGRGAIVNISSAAGVNGVRYGAPYAASKSGLQMLTRVTAAEWGRYGIRANCIAVGLVASERAVDAWKVANIDPDAMTQGIPLGRIGQPIDIAMPVLFLCSQASSWMSGQTFSVDGGPTMGGPAAED